MTTAPARRASAAALILIAAACGKSTPTVEETATTTTAPSTGPTADCVPSESAYDNNAAALIETACGECHGSTPDFGAPQSLVDGYADLIAGEEGERKVDAMVRRLMDGDMPPATSPQLEHSDLDTLVGWASCGAEHPSDAGGLVVNREVWDAPADPPAGTVPLELTAQDEEIGPTVLDDYRSFRFDAVVDEPTYVRRIEPVIDDSRVLHHITLTYNVGFPFLYAWAPGTGAIEFPDGGMLINPSDSFVVEIHYNNGAGVEGAVDSSGVRMWLSDTADIEYGMMSPSTWDMVIPPQTEASFTQTCTASMDFEILAGMPHMHQTGSTFQHDVTRSDGTVDNLIELSGWAFESQYFYEMPMSVKAGDQLTMTCGYFNGTDQTVYAGANTADEMCFDFLVVTPPSAAYQCLF